MSHPRLTLLSYLLSFLCGALVIIPFLVKVPAAVYFRSDLAQTGYIFSFFMIGMVISQYLNGFLVRVLSVKAEIFLITWVYLLSLLMMTMVHDIVWLVIPLVLTGLCAGITTTLPNFIIVHAFEAQYRSSRLNRLDFFFSAGSFVYPFISGILFSAGLSWVDIYISVLVIFIVINALIIRTELPHFESHSFNDKMHYSSWNLNVYLVAMAILTFFLSYVGFTYWLEPYLQVNLKMSVDASNFALTLFWVFYAIGCLLSSFFVQFVKLSAYIMGSLVLTLIAYALIVGLHDLLLMQVALSLLGLGCATVYSSGISYGTLQVERASPRMVSLFVTCSGIGTLLGESYSSYVEASLGFQGVLIASISLMGLSLLLFVIVMSKSLSRHEKLIILP